MTKADKLLSRMRQNPAGDWTIQDIERLCNGLGWRCLPPTGGGSHWKVTAADEYAILVEPLADADGGGWLASVPALPGCMGDGETREAALAYVQNAIAEWKDAARQLGRDVPGPAALGQWRQRAPRSLHEKLKIIAAREGVSLNAFVTSVLAEAVGKKSA